MARRPAARPRSRDAPFWVCANCRESHSGEAFSLKACPKCFRGRIAGAVLRTEAHSPRPEAHSPPRPERKRARIEADALTGAARVDRNREMQTEARNRGLSALELRRAQAEAAAARLALVAAHGEAAIRRAEVDALRKEQDALRKEQDELRDQLQDREDLEKNLILSENQKMSQIDDLKAENRRLAALVSADGGAAVTWAAEAAEGRNGGCRP
ncbi:hypothetical protein M885DRAFT_499214 [Pelagophyceae sp. CCMP2097]|nr:hypothetical protein M885DRAFT_499214 [Pelagophyceae sp. CCMP2097]